MAQSIGRAQSARRGRSNSAVTMTGHFASCLAGNVFRIAMNDIRIGTANLALSKADLERLLYCVNEVISRRRLAGIPVPNWMFDLGRRMDIHALADQSMSANGHGSDVAGEQFSKETLIGTREAARLLGLSPRHVRRIASDMDGEKVGGKTVFRLSVINEYRDSRGKS